MQAVVDRLAARRRVLFLELWLYTEENLWTYEREIILT